MSSDFSDIEDVYGLEVEAVALPRSRRKFMRAIWNHVETIGESSLQGRGLENNHLADIHLDWENGVIDAVFHVEMQMSFKVTPDEELMVEAQEPALGD
jgi:hypothetical protein